jgi:hypothetical protein
MVLRDIVIALFQLLHDIVIVFFHLLHDIVVELVKPFLYDIASGIKEVFVTLEAAVKEVWLFSSIRNISRLLATAVILTMLPPVAKSLHKIMETKLLFGRGLQT